MIADSIIASTTICPIYLFLQLLSTQLHYASIVSEMTTTAEDQKLTAWRMFLATYGMTIRALEHEMLEDQGIPLTWYEILARLDATPDGRMQMKDLAECILLSRSGLTRLFDRMAAEGLVDRHPCPEDRRGTYAAITDEGRSKLNNAMPSHIQSINEHFLRYLDVFDVQALQRVMTKVLDAEHDDSSVRWWETGR